MWINLHRDGSPETPKYSVMRRGTLPIETKGVNLPPSIRGSHRPPSLTRLTYLCIWIGLFSDLSWGHLPSPHFTKHSLISPELYSPRLKRGVASSQEEGVGGHAHHLTLGYVVEGKEVVVDLQLNRDLLPDNYFQKYHHKGEYVINRPTKDEVELCHYKGSLRGHPGSWAAISTCSGIHGVVFDGLDAHHIERVEEEDRYPGVENPHYIYNQMHTNHNRSCGVENSRLGDLPESTTQPFFTDPTFNRILRHKRDISSVESTLPPLKVDVKGPWNANKRSRYVELLIVVDNRKFKDNDQDLNKVYRKCKDMANIANALYAPLNIYIALVGVVVWSEYDEITLSTNGDTTLTNFLHYRRERLVKEHPNDNAQLLTGIQFDSGVVGKALLGPMCTYEFSGGVSTWHSEVVGLVATTMAHEMGHNFGMEHDRENCKCPEERCIMSESSSTMKPYFWSSCSLEYLALSFEHGMDYCLRNKPRTLFSGPVCGNGFVEPGEECDCGLKDHCDNPCCNAITCRMFANATCATGECCDFKTCRPKTPGEVCRLSEHECDLPEYCTGTSEFCPKDIFKVDGIPCKVGKSYCFQGSCRTHSDQCRLLWGPSGRKSDNQCYEQNRKGSRHGNCGYNRVNQSYISCINEDVRCGMLHCSHLNEKLEFGMESVSILSHSFINSGGKIIPCRSVLVDLGLDEVDPGLAPEGARCGEDNLCVNQKCIPVASLKIGPLSCPNNCHDRGTCNSVGHCHCDVGWAPPFCESPGPGGSLDSGPASNPEGDSTLPTILYIIFLVLLPVLLILLCVLYLSRGRLHLKQSRGEDGFIKVERRRSSRPPSRLNIDTKDISGPISVEAGQSLSSSPTHALLPRSTTQTSDFDNLSVSVENTNETKKPGLFSTGMFGQSGFGYKKSQDQLDSPVECPPPYSVTETSTKVNGSRSRASNLIKSFNKSISFPSSFPSPKFRASLRKQSSDTSKYEVKIEPRQMMDISPMDNPREESIPVSQATKLLAPPETRSSVPPPIHPKPNISVASSRSLSTFVSSRGTKASTLPPSLSLAEVKPTSPPDKEPEKTVSRTVSPTPCSTVSPTHSSAICTAPPMFDFRNDPKLAFPHSSSFTGGAPKKEDKTIPESRSAGSISSKNTPGGNKLFSQSSYLNRNPIGTNRTFSSPYSTNIQPVQSPFLKKPASEGKPVTTLTVSPFSQAHSPTSVTSPVLTQSLSKASGLDPPKPLAGKHTIWSVMEPEKLKPGEKPKSEEKFIVENAPASEDKPKPADQPKLESPNASTVSQSRFIVTKAATKPKTLDKAKSPEQPEKPNPEPSGKPNPELSEKPTPENMSPSEPMKPSKTASTTKPNPGAPTQSTKPVISRPVFQTATPNGASIIAKAPSTGISQTSILATKEKELDPFKPPREKGRRAIFCDPITLPSPTSPNNPPIIHQPQAPCSTDATVGKMITPTWSVQPSLVTDQVQVCHIAGKSNSDNSPGTADKSTFSKLISNVRRTPSLSVADRTKDKDKGKSSTLPRKPKGGRFDRNSLRNLEISSPVLQTELAHKVNLVPVICSSPDLAEPSPAPVESVRQPSPSSKRAAPKPPTKPIVSPTKPLEISSPIKTFDSKPQNDDIKAKEKTSSRYNPPWRSNKGSKSSENRESAAPVLDSLPKVSNSDDSLDSSKREVQARSKRPASIATSKPVRPNAPPPKPPPSRMGSEEPSPQDVFINSAFSQRSAPLANIRETLSPSLNEPIYSIITEEASKRLSSTSQDEFETPLGSPTLAKKSPDTMSTGSSAEEDLMKEILKEVHVKSEGESIYSSLMRREKKKKRREARSGDS